MGIPDLVLPPPPLPLQALKDRRRIHWASGRSWRSGHVDNLADDVAGLPPRPTLGRPRSDETESPYAAGFARFAVDTLQPAPIAIDLAGELSGVDGPAVDRLVGGGMFQVALQHRG
jgi:hypothetical protein